MKILVINGSNLNMLGKREPEIYGRTSLEDINTNISSTFPEEEFIFFQSNHEGEIIDFIQENYEDAAGALINPGAFTHYSFAILDAIKSVDIPFVEVHISNIHQREDFRSKSVTAMGVKGIISGFGPYGYILGVNALKNIL
jgi:3-dehydroquinate dehydratase-2